MGKVKGVLKNISGGLKLAYPVVALVLGVGGAIGIGVPTAIAHSVVSSNLVEKYTATQEYQDYIHENVVELDKQYQDGDIVLAEYLDAVEELKSDEYYKIAEIIKENPEKNAEYVKTIETLERLKTSAISGCILASVGVAELIGFLGFGKKLLDSAEQDFIDAEREFEMAKKKKEVPVETQPKKVSKSEEVVDISEDTKLKELGDEYYRNWLLWQDREYY